LENFTASNSNRAWATRATRGIFVIFREFKGISVFYLYSGTQVIFGGPYWYFWYFCIYKYL
jgi:hypothetical protein